MDPAGIAKAAVAILTPLLTALGIVFGRRARLRAEIKNNLQLLTEVRDEPLLQADGLAAGWLAGKVLVDTAKLTGQPLGPRKSPIPWSSVVLAGILAVAAGLFTWWLNQRGPVWYSVFPATFALAMSISVVGMLTGRQLPDEPDLPAGASEIRTDTAEEQVATRLHVAATGGDPALFASDAQIGVALRFVSLLGTGAFEDAIRLAEPNWLLCRIQARLWNMHLEGTLELDELQSLATSLLEERRPRKSWDRFAADEAEQFAEAWAGLNADTLGAASRRRRIARDLDLVVLTKLGTSGHGYFVTTATALPGAMTILLRQTPDGWRVTNHLGIAPPAPGWPPTWWVPGDSALTTLTELGDPAPPPGP